MLPIGTVACVGGWTMKATREKLNELRYDFGVVRKVRCSEEEISAIAKQFRANRTLPEGIEYGKVGDSHASYFRYEKNGLSLTEMHEFVNYAQMKKLNAIKTAVVYIAVLVSIVAAAYAFSRFSIF